MIVQVPVQVKMSAVPENVWEVPGVEKLALPVAPVAPVAPVVPVAPVAPAAPTP